MRIFIVTAGTRGTAPRLFQSFKDKNQANKFAREQIDLASKRLGPPEPHHWDWVEVISHEVETGQFHFMGPFVNRATR